jgi:signal transduction histidine kinase
MNLVLQSTIVVFVFCLVVGFTDLQFGNIKSAINDFILSAICIICLVLFYKGQTNASKILLVCCTILIVTINSSREGPDAGNQFLWFCGIVGTFTLFSINEKKQLIVLILLWAGSLLFCELTDYSFIQPEDYNSKWVGVNYNIVLILSIIVTLFFLTFMVRNMNISIQDKDRQNNIINKQKVDLENAHIELDKFVYHASHDLRSPIQNLIGLVEVAKESDNQYQIKELILKQESTLHSLDKHIHNILTLAKVKNSNINYSPTDFNEVYQEVLRQCELMISENNIKINLQNNLQGPILSDPMRLDKILFNLISNSIKYCDQLKSIKTINISIEEIKSYIVLIVEDNGVGIDAQGLLAIEQKVHSNEIGKSGLGLQIVSETVESLKGKMKIESKLGYYTKVTIRFAKVAKA